MNAATRKIKSVYAVLQGGNTIEVSAYAPHLRLGDTVSTQWGPRKVVEFRSVSRPEVRPDGVDYAEHALARRSES